MVIMQETTEEKIVTAEEEAKRLMDLMARVSMIDGHEPYASPAEMLLDIVGDKDRSQQILMDAHESARSVIASVDLNAQDIQTVAASLLHLRWAGEALMSACDVTLTAILERAIGYDS